MFIIIFKYEWVLLKLNEIKMTANNLWIIGWNVQVDIPFHSKLQSLISFIKIDSILVNFYYSI